MEFYRPYIYDYNYDVEIYFGSRNSGKSWFVFDKHILLALKDIGSVTGVIRKYKNSLKESSWKNVIERLNYFHIPYTDNKTEMHITLFNGSRFVFAGADDPDKIKSIQRLERVIYEEADAISKEEYDVISGSIRGSSNIKFESFMFNPPRHEFWMFDFYMKRIDLEELYEKKILTLEDSKVRIFHTTWRDNEFADHLRLEKKYSYMKEHDYFRWLRDSEGRLGFSESEYCLVPYKFLDKARKSSYKGSPKNDDLAIGIDCARFGNDNTIITARLGNQVFESIKLSGKRGHEIAEFSMNYGLELKKKFNYKGRISISVDDTGLGASTSDAIVKLKKDKSTKYRFFILYEINFSNKAVNEDLFSNLITEIAFYIKDLLISEDIKIPDSKELIEEISLREYYMDKKNRQILESKDEFKKKYGKSPDFFDSLLMCFANRIKKKVVFC